MRLDKILDGHVFSRLRQRVLPNLRHLPGSAFRRCGCCETWSFFIALGPGDERKLCISCGANLRYEMLAECIRKFDVRNLSVLEIGPGSPVTSLLAISSNFIRSFYNPTLECGTLQDGMCNEDITALTLPDSSLDLIVSADVLEHVPDIRAAFRESARVLKPGGSHLFTVPTTGKTIQRADICKGAVRHFTVPEYHDDPLNPDGILAYWSFGHDLGEIFGLPDLDIRVVLEPQGEDGRVVWQARRLD